MKVKDGLDRADAGRCDNHKEFGSRTTVLVSGCLLGMRVRYDGTALTDAGEPLVNLLKGCRIIAACPEVEGGMPVPREPVEIKGGEGRDVLAGKAKVVSAKQHDFTADFVAGARKILDCCKQQNVTLAILTEKSPSCGTSTIYDGSFMGRKVRGAGVTTALLREHGVLVCSQHDTDIIEQYLASE